MSPRCALFHQLARDVRHKTLQIVKAAHEPELRWAPRGTANTILWHAGHAVWLSDVLCIQIATGQSELPAGWRALFGMGSRPSLHAETWPPQEVLAALQAQLVRVGEVLDGLADPTLDHLPPFAHAGDERTLAESILHAFHDEANHQGEMYLLLKMQRLAQS